MKDIYSAPDDYFKDESYPIKGQLMKLAYLIFSSGIIF